ncbi:3-ketoacyl-CoA thiolase A, peroxisomal [Lingula anatina]|uniref:3-ketoacyl-CoA thiolase A, peroxisomal n=1 Tax=Lingula anatina TaxID=7574 RepID=A0A1S3HUD4_LINAN|nr:3-ketoacyl-CoA thiolase A, peroxisomal [Lingula anatina]|eukprot:XP_013388669.1 3-ketoacyl-CoA thiolase A, peroxisomal [Lingula anatina]
MTDCRKVFFGQLSQSSAAVDVHTEPCMASRPGVESDDDIVILAARRTPIGKAKRGMLKDTRPEDMLSTVFKALLEETKLDPRAIGDICVGNVLLPGAGALQARFGQFFSDIPETTPISAVNRQCSSGLQAVMNVAGDIAMGVCDIGIGAGVESMSQRSIGDGQGQELSPKVFDIQIAQDCLIPMGITSENVAERYGVDRKKQDAFSLLSQQRAATAASQGLFDAEIVPITTTVKDKNGDEKTVTVSKDEGIRPTTAEGLAKLRPAFKPGGTTTAGNSSQVSDGAAAVLLARRSAAKKLGLPVFGVIRSFAVVGVPPDVMGIGPAYAIPEALKKAGLTVDDIDIFEINEAFASQAVYCVEKLGIPFEKVNPKGGAIALGHPLGCTGSRQIATALHEMKRRGKRGYAVISMCIGTGMGAAAVIEYPGLKSHL